MDHDYIETHDISSRYVAGRLPDGEEREFEAHLVDCPQCLDAVESEMSLREGLRIVGSQSAPQLAAPATPPASMATRAYPFFRAAAAILLAVSVGLAAWLARSTGELRDERAARIEQQHRAEQAEQTAGALEKKLADRPAPDDARAASPAEPVLPAAVFALTTVRGSGSADVDPVNRIRIDGSAKLVVFSLEIPPVTASGNYEVSLKDRASRLVWSGGPFPPSPSDTLGVAIDPALLPGGDYVLELSQRSAAGRLTLIGRYPFRVAAR
jgi:hypothetical protein